MEYEAVISRILAAEREARDAERAYSRYGDNWVDTLFRRVVSGRP